MSEAAVTAASAEGKILGRIKKMMALANDGAASEGERENALRMSYALLAKHNLSMMDVEGHARKDEEGRVQLTAEYPVYPWARQISTIVADLFFCKYYFCRHGAGKQATHTFVGKESNAITTQYMAEYVVRSVMREASKLYGSAIAPEARNFAVGVVVTLHKRVREIQDAFNKEQDKAITGTALALLNLSKSELVANDAWMTSNGVTLTFRKSTQKGITDSAAFRAGKDFGGKVSLSQQIANR
jgi:hypothetical protein